MTTSQKMSFLSEIIEGKKIPLRTLAYFRERLRNRLYSMVVKEFLKQSETHKLNKAEIARRIGRKPEQITRWLGLPSNWTLDTVSDLMLAMGAEPDFSIALLAHKIALTEADSEESGLASSKTILAPEPILPALDTMIVSAVKGKVIPFPSRSGLMNALGGSEAESARTSSVIAQLG
jgi:hypothetical protein